jgi:hypothetical protein
LQVFGGWGRVDEEVEGGGGGVVIIGGVEDGGYAYDRMRMICGGVESQKSADIIDSSEEICYLRGTKLEQVTCNTIWELETYIQYC